MNLKHFNASEFVPVDTYKARGQKSLQLIDDRLLIFIDKLRETLGRPIAINSTARGLQYRGLRTSECREYKKYSQHSFGRALDFDVEGMTSDAVRQWIIDNRDVEWVKPIRFIEDGVDWVHVDVRATDENDSLWLWHVKTHETKIYKRG